MVENVLLSHPEVTGVARRTGRAELDEHAQGVEAAELDVSFKLGGPDEGGVPGGPAARTSRSSPA